MATPLTRISRSAGAGPRLAVFGLGLIVALAPAPTRASVISRNLSGHALHNDWESLVHDFKNLENRVIPHHAHAPKAAHPRTIHPTTEHVASTSLATPHQVHAAAMDASNSQLSTVTVRPFLKVTAVNGLLPATPAVDYLKTRRGLNVTRFDRYHPRLGAMLAEDEQLKAASLNTTPVTAAEGVAPAPPTTIHTIHPAQENVPEPSTATIALALIVSVALARRFRRHRA